MTQTHVLAGWSIGHAEEQEWQPWGSRGDAKAKILATGDGYLVALVQADPGYRGDPHEHANTCVLLRRRRHRPHPGRDHDRG